MPFKVYVDTNGTLWSTNALEFDTYEKAKEYGNGLQWRWTAVRKFAVVEVRKSAIDGREIKFYLTTEEIEKRKVVA